MLQIYFPRFVSRVSTISRTQIKSEKSKSKQMNSVRRADRGNTPVCLNRCQRKLVRWTSGKIVAKWNVIEQTITTSTTKKKGKIKRKVGWDVLVENGSYPLDTGGTSFSVVFASRTKLQSLVALQKGQSSPFFFSFISLTFHPCCFNYTGAALLKS